jgi:hypothetical protein
VIFRIFVEELKGGRRTHIFFLRQPIKKKSPYTCKSRAYQRARLFFSKNYALAIRIEMEQRIQQFHDDTKTIPKPPNAKTMKQMNTLKKFIFKNQV